MLEREGEAQRPKIDVVMPVLDAMRYLPTTLPAVLAACERYGPAGTVVADNGSKDGSLAFVKQLPSSNLRFLEVPGVAVGAVRNRAVAVCSGDLLVFLDADCLVDEDYLVNIERVFASGRVDAAGCRYSLPSNPRWIEQAWDLLHLPVVEGVVRYVNSGNFAVRREIFGATGGFDEILRSGEDAEFCARLYRDGWAVTQTTAIRAVHLGNPKSLPDFFRKQLWHGQGALGTARRHPVDRPLLMTLVHWLLLSCALLLALSRSVNPAAKWSLVATAPLLAPLATVFYRIYCGGSARAAVPGILLYFMYYSARGMSLVQLSLLAFWRRVSQVVQDTLRRIAKTRNPSARGRIDGQP